MIDTFFLRDKIKRRIKELLDEKNIKHAPLSVKMGYKKNFLATYFGKKNAFFNLEHIEKICAALNYPVSRLFADIEAEKKPDQPPNIMQRKEDAIPGFGELRQMLLSLPEDQRNAVIAHVKSTVGLILAQHPEEDAKKKMA